MVNVLVIEPEEIIRWSFREMLAKAGHRVFCAGDLDEGIALSGELRPRIVFVDVARPHGDGSAIVARLREHLVPPVAVVMMTASEETCTEADARRLGAAAYLRKPFDFAALDAVIDRVLRGSVSTGQAGRPVKAHALRLASVLPEAWWLDRRPVAVFL